MERKLAAILHADVKGYSRLIGEDEAATLHTLTSYLEMMSTHVRQHGGRVAGSAGDSLLAEFLSVVEAVQCAVEMQHELKVRNAELPAARRVEFRMGINLGEIVVEGEQIHGEGINIAVRLEGLAEAGGICISEIVYDQIKNKLAVAYEYLGEHFLKNIAKPVSVWRVREPGAAVLTANRQALALPDKPSIAVLPFVNLSSDPEQEYFSDGITEDLITDLSKLSGLFVIARNSTFVYKGKAVKIEQVSKELGVRYVLEGSVRKASTRVRITAQLVDATTSHHLWAERYDRELQDIFALQDEITHKIVGALEVKLSAGEQARVGRVPTNNLEAYDYFLRGIEYFGRSTQEADVQARQMIEKAVELDPEFAAAYLVLGWAHVREWDWLWSQDAQALDQALALAQKALSLDDSLAGAHSLLGTIYARQGQPEHALAEGERAVALDPNNANAYEDLAVILLIAEHPEEAVGLVEKAMRLDPQNAAYYAGVLGWAYRLLGRYEEAIAALKRTLTRNPNILYAHVELAGIYNELGRTEEARAEGAEVRRLSPHYPLESLQGSASLKGRKEERERSLKGADTDNPQAYAYFMGGFGYFFRYTQEANAQARQMWEQATELDPQFAAAHAALGITYLLEWGLQWSQDPQTLERALTLARGAIALADSLPLAHQLLAGVYLLKKQPECALVESERVIALDPDNGDSYGMLAGILLYTGRPEEAIRVLEKALGLNPRLPSSLCVDLGLTYHLVGRDEDALGALQKALSFNPNYPPTHETLAVLYSELGREEEARAEVAEVLRISPNYSLEGVRGGFPSQIRLKPSAILPPCARRGAAVSRDLRHYLTNMSH